MGTPSSSFSTVNPTNGAELARYAYSDAAAIGAAMAKAEAAAAAWRQVALPARTALLTAWARELRDARQGLAKQAALEMGKPLSQGLKEVDKCALTLEYYAQHAAGFLADEPQTLGPGLRSFVRPRPLGVILGVMPWNFPYWQVVRFAAPTLAAGNVVVIKHADNSYGCALLLQAAFERAAASVGAPGALFQTLPLSHAAVHDLIGDPRLAAVSLTGSERAGSAVAARAGACLKKTVLELGGSDPYVVLDDADLAPTIAACVEARLVNAGQSCVAAKRFVVTARHYDQFVEGFVGMARLKKMGDPLADGTDVGPLARGDLRAGLAKQVSESIAHGARAVLGGALPGGPGSFYPVTVLTGVVPGMPAFDQELFGPVAAIVRAADESDAMRLAAHSNYALGAAVFSRDSDKAVRLATTHLPSGFLAINGMVQSDPRLPFGGVKQSGYGRELSRAGMMEFVNLTTVVVHGQN
jgi:succinate-semialdehyde dehydrogenase/glutarate-semialdehyde dehydrogenase